MRRKLPTFVFAVAVALATAGIAAAANGGLSPQDPASPNARNTITAYWVIVGFTAVIFFLVEGLLVVFIWKYRSRGRDREAEGPQVHGHTRLELIWTVIPVIILCAIGTVVFFLLPKIDSAPASSPSNPPINVVVEGHQFYWQFDYPGGAKSINTLFVPVNTVVNLTVISPEPDVIHSWWIPELGGKIQAIPGRVNHSWFMAERVGRFEGQCAELCGVFHSQMKAQVVAESRSQYDAYVNSQAAATLGQQEWYGVCATCHGNLGEGGYGPNIASNSLLIDPKGLKRVLHNGVVGSIGAMPPVGVKWNRAQVDALVAYVTKSIYQGPKP